ncbi:hypothetical protein FF1_010423 [Malus domestica]
MVSAAFSYQRSTSIDCSVITLNQVLFFLSFYWLCCFSFYIPEKRRHCLHGFLSDIFDVPRYQKSRKYLQPNRWLQSWWRREIQALVQEEDVDIVMHHIHGVINSSLTRDEQKGRTTVPEEKQREFQESTCDAAGPFLAARTNRFVNEVELFLVSGLKIEAYDAVCMQRLGWSAPGVTTEPAEVELAEHRPVIPYLYIFFYSDRSE